MAGSLLGGLLYEHAGVSLMLAASVLLTGVALSGMAAGRHLFDVSCQPAGP